MSRLDAINNGRFWCQFLVVTLINLCITSLMVGFTVFYVHKELQAIKESENVCCQQSPGTMEPGMPDGDLADNSTFNEDSDSSTERGSGGSSGVTYVRWGRTICSNGTGSELVYTGSAASAHDRHPGGSVDFFCLPTDPDWSASYNDGLNSQSYLFGMEYKVESFDPFSYENAEFLDQRSVPCAVCHLTDRGSQLLIPAKLGCPVNWTEEYRGFLMSGNHDHAQRSQAVCVDEAPEVVSGSQKSGNGALIYIMEGRCTSGLCPPYIGGREITCTVCSI